MKRLIYSLFLIAGSMITITSCMSNDTASSSSVKQSEIFQTYIIDYNASKEQCEASVSFRFGGPTGTTLELSKPSTILLNGKKLRKEESIFWGTYYKSILAFENEYVFKFTDLDNKIYTNSFRLNPVIIIPVNKNIENNTNIIFHWEGKPIFQGEKMTLYLIDETGKEINFVSTAQGAQSITVGADKLQEITPGTVSYYFVRYSERDIKESTHLGGTEKVTYTTKKGSFTLYENQSTD